MDDYQHDRLLNAMHRQFEMHHGVCWTHVVRNCTVCKPTPNTHDADTVSG